MGTLRDDKYTFFIMSHSVLLKTRNISDQVVQKIKAHISSFFSFENCTVHEIMWENTVESDWLQMTVWRMFIALRMPKATNAFSGSVTLTAFPQQKCLHERASMLRYSPLPALFNRVWTAKEPTRFKTWTAAWNWIYSSANCAQSKAPLLNMLHDEGNSFFQNILRIFQTAWHYIHYMP